MQRSTRTILSDAHAQLQFREAELSELQLRLAAELSFARASMVAIEGLLAGKRVALHIDNGAVVRRGTGELKRAVLECVREWGDLISREELADATGVQGRGLQIVIGQAIAAGELFEAPNGLGIPSTLLEREDG